MAALGRLIVCIKIELSTFRVHKPPCICPLYLWISLCKTYGHLFAAFTASGFVKLDE